MRASRATVVDVLAAVAFLLLGVWGVINLSDGDWFIGGVFVVCAVSGLGSTAIRVLRTRRQGSRGPFPPADNPAG